jgi:hypothetical protein
MATGSELRDYEEVCNSSLTSLLALSTQELYNTARWKIKLRDDSSIR